MKIRHKLHIHTNGNTHSRAILPIGAGNMEKGGEHLDQLLCFMQQSVVVVVWECLLYNHYSAVINDNITSLTHTRDQHETQRRLLYIVARVQSAWVLIIVIAFEERKKKTNNLVLTLVIETQSHLGIVLYWNGQANWGRNRRETIPSTLIHSVGRILRTRTQAGTDCHLIWAMGDEVWCCCSVHFHYRAARTRPIIKQ